MEKKKVMLHAESAEREDGEKKQNLCESESVRTPERAAEVPTKRPYMASVFIFLKEGLSRSRETSAENRIINVRKRNRF